MAQSLVVYAINIYNYIFNWHILSEKDMDDEGQVSDMDEEGKVNGMNSFTVYWTIVIRYVDYT